MCAPCLHLFSFRKPGPALSPRSENVEALVKFCKILLCVVEMFSFCPSCYKHVQDHFIIIENFISSFYDGPNIFMAMNKTLATFSLFLFGFFSL